MKPVEALWAPLVAVRTAKIAAQKEVTFLMQVGGDFCLGYAFIFKRFPAKREAPF